MTYTEHARRYLLSEGLSPETVFKTGSPMKEVLSHYKERIKKSEILSQLSLQKNEYFIVSTHREENIDNEENFNDLLISLNLIAETYKKPLIVSTHPRTRKKLESVNNLEFNNRIRFLKPLSFSDYIKLQTNAFCVISDSGTITEESSILNFPAITIRQAHERPEGVDEGTLIMSGLKSDSVLSSIKVVTSQFYESNNRFKIIDDYNTDNVSIKVVRIILSYTDYVNRNVWKKKLL
jgi:UDP-N-acetylglucosamine 2-epimerase (non-hydrolysing)